MCVYGIDDGFGHCFCASAKGAVIYSREIDVSRLYDNWRSGRFRSLEYQVYVVKRFTSKRVYLSTSEFSKTIYIYILYQKLSEFV